MQSKQLLDMLSKTIIAFLDFKYDNFRQVGNFIKISVLLVLTSHNVPYVIFMDYKKEQYYWII